MEYFENTGNAVAKLSWSSANQFKQIIPQSQLYPGRPGLSILAAVAGTNGLLSIGPAHSNYCPQQTLRALLAGGECYEWPNRN